MSKKGFFITGTDTGVGKTFFTSILMKKYNFEVYQYEWWHFNYNDCNSKILNYSFEELDSLLF